MYQSTIALSTNAERDLEIRSITEPSRTIDKIERIEEIRIQSITQPSTTSQPSTHSMDYTSDRRPITKPIASNRLRDSGSITQTNNMRRLEPEHGAHEMLGALGGNRPDGVALNVDVSESSGTVGRSGIDEFKKVNNFTAMADSHLVNSMSFLNLGSKGSCEAAPSMNNNPKP
ncbi:hypothetical protein L1887_20155 [Cichorium endivia]|nr:hypothetical protein L1887_20155 [Cichorium endivia]